MQTIQVVVDLPAFVPEKPHNHNFKQSHRVHYQHKLYIGHNIGLTGKKYIPNNGNLLPGCCSSGCSLLHTIVFSTTHSLTTIHSLCHQSSSYCRPTQFRGWISLRNQDGILTVSRYYRSHRESYSPGVNVYNVSMRVDVNLSWDTGNLPLSVLRQKFEAEATPRGRRGAHSSRNISGECKWWSF